MKIKPSPLIVIAGPTGVGKTNLAHQLAIKFKGEIVSSDSRQVYRYMDIGTSKPPKYLQEELPYHLLDIVEPDQHFTVADFKQQAEGVIEQIHLRGHLPFLVGGTGLYIKAITSGLFPSPPPFPAWRQEMLKQEIPSLYEELSRIDPETAARLNPNDSRRIIRALEVYHQTGLTISYLQHHKTERKDYDLTMICLTLPRPQLYSQIEERVDRMIGDGFVEEVESLLQMGYTEELISMEALGYRQIIGYLKGNYSLKQAIALIKQVSRNFAKRQLTWFRAEKRFQWFEPEEKDKILKLIYPLKEVYHDKG